MISNASAARRSEGIVVLRALVACVIFGLVPAVPAFADDAARVSRLESEIQQLRAQVDEQNRRIQRLEAELARRSGGSPSAAAPRRAASDDGARKPAPAGPQPWHSPAPWSRVGKGMSEDEVVALLGEPTAVESVEGFKTLFYRGATAAGASVNGMVNLRDERVVAVVMPAF
jgi:hypothetical protein